ncbi:MAG TPA: hypothetical protein VFT08_08345 [Pyrinomonadaceae bacterium]|nr:hypothetical protein [Pyrinomonadaceae bacterium]
MKTERARSSVTVLCFPQVHFHFATHVSSANARRSAPAVFRAATIYRERVVRDRGWTGVITINHTAQLRSASRPSAINYAREESLPKVSIEKTEPLPFSRFFAPIAKQFARRPHGSFAPPVTATLRVNTRREELTRSFKTYWRTYEQRSRVLPQRLPEHNTYILAGPTKRTQIQSERPEELVWRRVPPPVISEDVRHANISESSQQQPVRTVDETPVQQFSTPLGRTTQTQITKIDPGLLDRLTDDVIRRVEKRARIERQRRGL